MTGARSRAQGLSERLLARYARGGPSLGPVAEVLTGLGYALAAAAPLPYDRRAWAIVLIVLAAWRGGMAGVLAEREGAQPWQRSLGATLNLSAEGTIVVAVAFWTREHQDRPGPLAMGFLAFAGALLLGYARVRIRASAALDLPDGPFGMAAREVRLLVLAVGLVAGEAYWAMVAVALLGHVATLGHLARLRATLAG